MLDNSVADVTIAIKGPVGWNKTNKIPLNCLYFVILTLIKKRQKIG